MSHNKRMSAALSFLRLLKYLKDVIYEASLNHLQLVVHILAKYNLFLRKKETTITLDLNMKQKS